MKEIYEKIVLDLRYKEGLAYGKPRKGHLEGTVEKHIEELERTLEKLKPMLTEKEYWKLKVLIHVHDAFKLESKRRTHDRQVPIESHLSHASLARQFLKEFVQDNDLLNMVQYHDESHALWMKEKKSGKLDKDRLIKRVISRISDLELYLIFTIIDGYTDSKLLDRSPRWFVDLVAKYRPSPRAYQALEILEVPE